MYRLRFINTIIYSAVYFVLISCSKNAADKSISPLLNVQESAPIKERIANSLQDSAVLQNEDVRKIYIEAIATLIKAAYKNDKTTFDTLYFGKHLYGQADDFPNIELPSSIENVEVKLVSAEEGNRMMKERKSLMFINLMAWLEIEKAEFIFVVFTNGGVHQYDYFINFLFNADKNKFELDNIEFENYINTSSQKPNRKIILSNGHYLRDH